MLTIDENGLYVIIGKQTVELTLVRQQNEALRAQNLTYQTTLTALQSKSPKRKPSNVERPNSSS